MRTRHVTGVLVGILLAASTPARAQSAPPADRTFSPQLFHPAVGPDEFLTVEPAQPLPHLNFSLGLWADYSRGGLTLYSVDASGNVGASRANLIQDSLAANLVFAIGLFNRLQIGLGIPVALSQSGEDFSYPYGSMNPTVKVAAPSGFALGDPWLDVKVRLFGHDRGAQIALALYLSVPASLANANSFGGDASVDVGGRVLAGYEGDRWRAGIDVGGIYRAQNSQLFSTIVGSELRYAGAFAFDAVVHRLTLVAELFGRLTLSSGTVNYATGPMNVGGPGGFDASPLELDVAGKLRVARSAWLTLGVGAGLHSGVGAPVARVLLGITYSPDRRDRDHDGIPDAFDKCPDQPEDRDGFQDEDGCPDPDNDGDQVADAKDKCPNDPEDYDQFQDEDGCPDPDNDQDGVPDLKDACPNDKEDRLPPKPDDGCPRDKADADGDGIPDYLDKCPDQPEDKDGFQDDDGCPDPDNDSDGYADKQDKCPNDPEDFDQFEDEDGCPDPDNDHDGIPDDKDKCPNEPETINGYQDEDGCPDKGPEPKVQIVGDDIMILDKVFFDTNKATIQKKSFNLLDQVASTIKAHGEIKKVRIEGHTDAQGNAAHNRTLSQQRAESVKKYLVDHGVDGARLDAQGFGPDRPVADNRTAKGREANRRVEFKITERDKPQPKPEQ